jgi:cytochrome P450
LDDPTTTPNNEKLKLQQYYNSLSDEDQETLIVSQGLILFIAGFDTTSTTLSLVMHYMARHPECQDKV